MKRKMDITIDELCVDLPENFKSLTEYARNLVLYEEPDYIFLRKKILDIGKEKDIKLYLQPKEIITQACFEGELKPFL